jgi:hypothetical protein
MGFLPFFAISTPILYVMIFAHLFSLYFLVDVIRSKFKDAPSKLFWVVVLVLIPVIGSIVYMKSGKLDKAGLA